MTTTSCNIIRKKSPNSNPSSGLTTTSNTPNDTQYTRNLMYSDSSLVPMTAKVMYPGMRTQAMVVMSGEMLRTMERRINTVEVIMARMDGFRVVFSVRAVSWGQVSREVSCSHEASCYSFSIVV